MVELLSSLPQGEAAEALQELQSMVKDAIMGKLESPDVRNGTRNLKY